MCLMASRFINIEETKYILEKYEFPVTTNASIEIEAAYWKNAPAIHNWFVKHVQEYGGKYYVSRSDLRNLLETVHSVLEDRSNAAALLPIESDLEIGSNEYDQFYFSDLEYTAKTITQLLDKKHNGWDFHYISSW